MKKGKCWPEPRNGYREWRGWGILESRKHMEKSGRNKSSPFLITSSEEVTGSSETPSQISSSLGTSKLAWQTAQQMAQCVKLLKCHCSLRREARACQGATESSQAAKRRVCSHWERLAGILQTVAVMTHHNEATEQQGKTTSREGLAFSFQNKMGWISGQGCSYQGSHPQLIGRLCFFKFSQKIFPDTGTQNSGLLQQSMSNISPSWWSLQSYPLNMVFTLFSVSPQKCGRHIHVTTTLLNAEAAPYLLSFLKVGNSDCPVNRWVKTRLTSINSRVPSAIVAGRSFRIHL